MANDIKPFATGAGANVTPQTEWEGLAARQSGFQAGKANSAQVNKALRQASFIAAALAQYTADKSGEDVLDDGDIASFIAKMSVAFGKDFQPLNANLTALATLVGSANKLPFFTGAGAMSNTDLSAAGRELISKADVAGILQYLGLGDGPFVSAGGGSYDKTFKFGRIEVLPKESNPTALYNSVGSSGDGSIVSGASFQWYGHRFDIGLVRNASDGTRGFAIQYNGNNVALINTAGDIFAVRGLFESGGTVRAYSANNPPPSPELFDVRLGAVSGASPNTEVPGTVLVRFDAVGGGASALYKRPLQKLVNGAWVTVGVI